MNAATSEQTDTPIPWKEFKLAFSSTTSSSFNSNARTRLQTLLLAIRHTHLFQHKQKFTLLLTKTIYGWAGVLYKLSLILTPLSLSLFLTPSLTQFFIYFILGVIVVVVVINKYRKITQHQTEILSTTNFRTNNNNAAQWDTTLNKCKGIAEKKY